MATRKGNEADTFTELPMTAWWTILKRVYTKMQQHNLSLIAAGVAFYFLLAIFPLLAGIISLYGLLVSPDELQDHMTLLINVVPADSRYIIENQLESLINNSNVALSSGFIISLILTLWSSSKGANALITACNITYNETHSRSFLKAILARMVLTACIIIVVITSLIFITVLPQLLSWLTGNWLSDDAARWITWPVLMLVFNAGLATLYRYGPHRAPAKWTWVTPGSLLATVVWVIGSLAFSFYLAEFATYNKTYGSVGGIVILLMWLYLSAYIILLGAEFNSAMELQTERDSTTGTPKPKGARGAFVADHSPQDAPDTHSTPSSFKERKS
ncbi:YihY/virulence factor BrkB family protein [Alteromonas pelagimontana]|uniref:YihY/virulence factor BrkB family protein n=1 Tax=Alteromonas pelagimontana TaxID=1858656 RepID=A0A6M4MEC7_9ALTE|nr:YihY/virulence factor BrkB family protein [Alteromonas pelagimontana]QJR81208.1 YihY/virulence factor BrkB family protein [Alteromonas pelagimontana]